MRPSQLNNSDLDGRSSGSYCLFLFWRFSIDSQGILKPPDPAVVLLIWSPWANINKLIQMNALIFGGSGQLGRSMVRIFKGWRMTNVDLVKNEDCSDNIVLSKVDDLNLIKESLDPETKFHSIICVAGGWTGGSIKDDNLVQVYQEMHQKNVVPALICSHLATKFLRRQGLLVFTGAHSVFNGPTPSMIGYALAKTAVHTIAIQSAVGKELPEDATVITLLPETIDTKQNREAMPTSDFTKWAKPDQISGLVRSWAEGLNRPSNGSFVHLRVKNGTIAPDFL